MKKKILVGVAFLVSLLVILGYLGFNPNREQSQQVVQPGPEQAIQPGQPPRADQSISCKGTARCFTSIVKQIVDGDTLDIGDFRIRLALANTPERGQAGYTEATRFTTSTCPVGSEALVDEDDGQKEGSFDRIVAMVYCSDKNLNAELLVNKHAVIDTRFCSNSEFRSENWAIQGGCKTVGVAPVPQQPKLKILDAYYIIVEPSIRFRASTYRVNVTVIAEGGSGTVTHIIVETPPPELVGPFVKTNLTANLVVQPGQTVSWLSPKFAPGREPVTLAIFTGPQVQVYGYVGLSQFDASARALKASQTRSCFVIEEVSVRPAEKPAANVQGEESRSLSLYVSNNCDFSVTDVRIQLIRQGSVVVDVPSGAPQPGITMSLGQTRARVRDGIVHKLLISYYPR